MSCPLQCELAPLAQTEVGGVHQEKTTILKVKAQPLSGSKVVVGFFVQRPVKCGYCHCFARVKQAVDSVMSLALAAETLWTILIQKLLLELI